jgi:subtilisin-like proprotein convertase family protein
MILLSSIFITSSFADNRWIELQAGVVDSTPLVALSQTTTGIIAEVSIPGFYAESVSLGDGEYTSLTIPKCGAKGESGYPRLPFHILLIPVTHGPRIGTVTAKGVAVTALDQVTVMPSQAPEPDCGNCPPSPFAKNDGLYKQDDWWPVDPILAVEEVVVRGQRFLQIELSPLKVNPVRREVAGYPKLTLQVDLSGEVDVGAESLKLLRAKDSFATLVDGETADQLPTGIEYLVIAGDDFVTELAPLLAWKRLKGLTAEVVPMSTVGTTASDIKSYLLARYSADTDLTYVLLVGDHAQVPSEVVGGHVTDFYYSCLDGSDQLPDVVMGRISVDTAGDCANVVDKIVSYERTPDQGSWHGDYLMAALLQDYNDYNCHADRWFFETATHAMHYARDAVGMGIYTSATSSNLGCTSYYWRSDSYPHRPDSGTTVPADDAALLTTGSQATQDVSDAVNNGVSIVLHRDHGDVTLWGDPYFSTANIASLTNGTAYPVVFSINCLTGAFAYGGGDCLAEAFMKKYPGGSIGVVAASDVSYSGYNDLIAHGLHDCLWDDYDPADGGNIYPGSMRPAVALAYAKYYMLFWAGASSYSTYQHELFHWHGDPEMQVFTAVPVIANVEPEDPLPLGSSTLQVACDVEGALVAVTEQGTLLGRATVTGGQAVVTLDPAPESPTTLDVVVTGVNMSPWEGTIQVITAEGPWLVHSSHLIDDSAGNADGIVNPGEVISLPVSVENVGVELAGGPSATLSSTSTEVTVSDDSATYPDIAVGASAQSNPDHFSFSVDPAVGHLETLIFTLDWLTGEYSGSTRFTVQVCRQLEISNVSITEVTDRSARVAWTTNVPATSQVQYGVLSPTEQTVESLKLTTDHAVLLSNLDSCTRYRLTVSSESPDCYQVADTNGGLSYVLTTERHTSLMTDDVESGNIGWTADSPWAITDQDSHSASHSWTDSPDGNYSNYLDISLSSPVVNLLEQSSSRLSFFHKYRIEFGYDHGIVEATTDGLMWNELVRFDGILSEWSEEIIDLSDYDGSASLQLRFRLDSDRIISDDGWYLDDFEVYTCGSCSSGLINLDKEVYVCDSLAQIVVNDIDLDSDPGVQETVAVTVSSDTEEPGETVALTESAASSETFIGTVGTSCSAAAADGLLSISDADIITATYIDLDDGSGSPAVVTASAVADCLPPVITDVELTALTPSSALVTWLTNEPADSAVDWYSESPPATGSASEQQLTTSHSLVIDGLSQCSHHYLSVSSTDATGKGTTDDNGGLWYKLTPGIKTEIVDGSSPELSIPDGDLIGISSAVSISTPFPVLDVDVLVSIEHSYDDDIDIYLIGPDGTTVELSTDNGGFGNDYDGSLFDDAAGTSIVDGTAPFSGAFQPEQPLAAFNGKSAAGEWRLQVVDDSATDTGRLLSWQLQLTVNETCNPDALFADGFESGDTSAWSQN